MTNGMNILRESRAVQRSILVVFQMTTRFESLMKGTQGY
jgi:hypothetical protein